MVAAGLGAAGSIGLSSASFATGASKTAAEAGYKQAYNDAAAYAAKKYNGQANSVSIAMAGTQLIQSTTLNTNNTNASNDTNTSIAANNANTSNANAAASRNQSVDNAKRVMVNTRSNVNAIWRDVLNHAAQPVGAYGGDNFRQATGLDTMTVKIVTEDNGAIAAAGDYMLRYGIASNKLYNRPSLTPCKHFTYWQTADIWALSPLAQNEQLQTIRDIFSSGVTIWNRPEEVGGDFVHDNL